MQSIACHLGMHATTEMLVSLGEAGHAGDMHAAPGPMCGDHKTLDEPAGGLHASQKYLRVAGMPSGKRASTCIPWHRHVLKRACLPVRAQTAADDPITAGMHALRKLAVPHPFA